MADHRCPLRWTALTGLTILPASPAIAQTVEAMMARGRALTAPPPCRADAAGDIVVCARDDAAGRYRLPLPGERAVTPRPSAGGLVGAELLKAPGACGPSGTRRCTKAEALSQGFGGGRDPLTLAARLAGRLLDPE